MQLLRQDDPRSALDKARRQELVQFANANGLKEVSEEMPAIVIRKLLRERGLTNINVQDRQLGNYAAPNEAATETNVVDAEADLVRQFTEQKQPDVSALPMNELRAECRKRGIKMARTDNLQSLREKLNGKNAA